MHLTLVRHAESIWNATSQWQGQSDVPLSERGRAQAKALGERMRGARFDRRLGSDLARAFDTAAAIGEAVEKDVRLREIDVGAWAGLATREVAERFGDELEGLRAGRPVRIGGGESMLEFEARVDDVFDEIERGQAGKRVLAVTHGGVIRALAGRLLGFRGRTSPLVGATNTSITIVSHVEGRAVLEVYNDARHLDVADLEPASSPRPIARVALIAAEAGAPRDRALADATLSGLRIARIFAAGTARDSALARDLGAEGLATKENVLDAFLAEDDRAELALLLPPADVRSTVAALLASDPSCFALPPHGAVTQLRVAALYAGGPMGDEPRSAGAVLHSYAVALR